jgi:hypothetical protein
MLDTKSDRVKTKNTPNPPFIILPQAELDPNVYSAYFDFQNKESPSLFLDDYYYIDKYGAEEKRAKHEFITTSCYLPVFSSCFFFFCLFFFANEGIHTTPWIKPAIYHNTEDAY